ncbi:MAG: hypothetical protein K0U74_02745 [Alphaproteobacteria bacterium]|nr:hypothetical protein [Alphaproteobacteria bacterium]
MRFTTIGFVMAAVSATAYVYASLFQITGIAGNNSTGGAAWPTFLDSNRVIAMRPVPPPPTRREASAPAQAQLASRGGLASGLPALGEMQVIAAARASTRNSRTDAAPLTGALPSATQPAGDLEAQVAPLIQPLAALARLAQERATPTPPLPELAPKDRRIALRSIDLTTRRPILASTTIELPHVKPNRVPRQVPLAGRNGIVTGSIARNAMVAGAKTRPTARQVARQAAPARATATRAAKVAKTAAARKFERFKRSSLGGPTPPQRKLVKPSGSHRRVAALRPDVSVRSIRGGNVSTPVASPFRQKRAARVSRQRPAAAPLLRRGQRKPDVLVRPRRVSSIGPGRREAVSAIKPEAGVLQAKRSAAQRLAAARQAQRKSAAAKAKRARAAAAAARKARSRRSVQARRAALRRKAALQTKRKRVRRARQAQRRSRRGRRFSSYREFQAHRNRVIAQQIRRRRAKERRFYRTGLVGM